MGIREFRFSKLYRFANRSLTNNHAVMNQQDSGDRSPGFMMGWKPHQVLLGGKIRAQRSLAFFMAQPMAELDLWLIGGWLVGSDQLITGILKSDQLQKPPSKQRSMLKSGKKSGFVPKISRLSSKTPCFHRTVPKSSRALKKGLRGKCWSSTCRSASIFSQEPCSKFPPTLKTMQSQEWDLDVTRCSAFIICRKNTPENHGLVGDKTQTYLEPWNGGVTNMNGGSDYTQSGSWFWSCLNSRRWSHTQIIYVVFYSFFWDWNHHIAMIGNP